jgi:vacuole morphology and inheritance protein 14
VWQIVAKVSSFLLFLRIMADTLAIQASRKSLIEGKAEARAKAAQVITARTSQLFKDRTTAEAVELLLRDVRGVDEQLLKSTAAVYRRGGLICLRAICAGIPLHPLSETLVASLLDPVLRSMADADPIVRIAAVEACYFFVQQHGAEALAVRFTDLFSALCITVGDRDKRVFLLAEEVSCALQETVSRGGSAVIDVPLFTSFVSSTLGNYTSSSGTLLSDVTSAVPQWILSWLRFVMELPGCYFTASMTPLLRVLLAASVSDNANVFDVLRGFRQDVLRFFTNGSSADVCEAMNTLASCVHSTTSAHTRVFCLEWIGELVPLSVHNDVLQRYLPRALQAIVPQLGSKDGATHVAAVKANQEMQDALVSMDSGVTASVAEVLLRSVMELLSSNVGEAAQLGVLEWLLVVHHLAPQSTEKALEAVLDGIVVLMDEAADNVAQRATEVACLLSLSDKGVDLARVVRLVLQRLLTHAQSGLLLSRFTTIVRKLHVFSRSQPEASTSQVCVLVCFVEELASEADLRLVSKVVLSLHAMLTTFPEFDDVRALLRRGLADATAANLFTALRRCWCYNTVALLSLALMCRHYIFTRRLCEHLGDVEMSIATYVQLDHLVQQLESPAFAFLRVTLLRPATCPALVQTLHVLLLLLPQSSPHYELLRRRLQPIGVLMQIETLSGAAAAGDTVAAPAAPELDTAEWDTFIKAQDRLLRFELAAS